MHVVRRCSLLAVAALAALAALPLTATVAGGQALPESATTLTVRKVVVGTGAPSSVIVDCEEDDIATALDSAVLDFDAAGHPVATVPAGAFDIVDGAFVNSGDQGDTSGSCTFTETTTGGATSTSFTCSYEFTPNDELQAAQIEQAGCLQDAGTGVGPVQVNLPGSDEVDEQAATVVFTNTFTTAPLQPIQPAAQIVAQPAFTG